MKQFSHFCRRFLRVFSPFEMAFGFLKIELDRELQLIGEQPKIKGFTDRE